MADGTAYTIDIAAKVLGLDSASAKLGSLEQALNAAGAASETAAEALAAGEQKYAQLERAATKAAMALERAGAKTSGAVPADLAQKAHAAQAALAAEAVTLDKLKASAAGAAAEHSRLKDAHAKLEKSAKGEVDALNAADKAARGTGQLGKLKGALGDLGGPLGSTGQKVVGLADAFGDLKETLGAGAGGVVAIAVAVAAAVALVTVAIGAAIVKTAMWAVGLADAKRTAALTVEALEQTSASLAGLGKILPSIQRASGLSGDELNALAKQLAAAKVSAEDMPEALRAAAIAEKALAGEGAKLATEMGKGKRSVSELAREAEAKFGGIVSKKLLGLDEQTATLKKNLGDTFGGLKIEPLLEGLSKMVGLFDQTTAMGKTIKFLFEKMFQPLIDAAAKTSPMIEAFLLGVAIGALKVYIAFKPAAKEIGKLFDIDTSSLPDGLELAKVAGEALGETLGKLAAGVGFVVLSIGTAIQVLGYLGDRGAAAFGAVYNEAAKVAEFLGSVDLSTLGTDMMQGLADGIRSAGDKVSSAVKGVVDSAVSAAKKALGIASPSKVFEGIGAFTAEGFAGGVDDNAGGARSAVESLVAPPSLSAGAGASGGGNTFSITINAPDGKAESIGREIEIVLTRILQGDLTQLEPAGAA